MCNVRFDFDNGTCCEKYFDSKPIFFHTGTCYTMTKKIRENQPFVYSNIKFYMNLNSEKTPGTMAIEEFWHIRVPVADLTIKYRGFDALKRSGIFFTLTPDHEHAGASLLRFPKRAMPGTAVMVGVSKSVVRFANALSHRSRIILCYNCL